MVWLFVTDGIVFGVAEFEDGWMGGFSSLIGGIGFWLSSGFHSFSFQQWGWMS